MKKNDSLADEMSGGKPMRRKSNHDYRTIVTIMETNQGRLFDAHTAHSRWVSCGWSSDREGRFSDVGKLRWETDNRREPHAYIHHRET